MAEGEIMHADKLQLMNAQEERIFVSIRVRPPNEKERARNDVSEWECVNSNTIILKHSLPERSLYPDAYTFDRVFGCDGSTKQVFEEGIKEVALSVVSGINSSIFAYGQTSSGKTYTMSGITEFSVRDIYDYIETHTNRQFVLKFSAMEIYNEAVRDLLSADGAQLRVLDDPEKGTVVEKLTEETLRDWSHLQELLSICQAERKIGETSLNEISSRSHQILRLTVESSARNYIGPENPSTITASVNFVDLAGSERASQTLSAGVRLREGSHINRSLLTLGTVIRKLSKGRNGHVPYRDSKLTRILQNCLGGNARTAIICTISPARSQVDQSRNTLLFASCAKQVTTNAQVNIVMSDKILVKQLQKELARLENKLSSSAPNSIPFDSAFLLKEKELLIEQMNKEIKELRRQRDIAQSLVNNFLQSRGHDWLPRVDEYSELESSVVANHRHLDLGSRTCSTNLDMPSFLVSNGQQMQQYEKLEGYSLMDGIATKFVAPNQRQGWEEIAHRNAENEDICKDVQCIEKEESGINHKREVDLSLLGAEEKTGNLNTNIIKIEDAVSSSRKGDDELSQISSDCTHDALKQKIQELQRTINSLLRHYPSEKSPGYCPSCVSRSRSLQLTRSRSCKAILMNTSSSEFGKLDGNTITSFSGIERDYSERPGSFRQRPSETNSRANKRKFSRKHSHAYDNNASVKGESTIDSDSDDTASVLNYVVRLKERTKYQFKKDFHDVLEEAKAAKTNRTTKPKSHLAPKFERQQRDIIKLWDACNVPLVHRTYFFLLVKGELSDSVYMEVELRRLSFLKGTFSSGMSILEENQTVTLDSSEKALNRERKMLSKQVHKKFSTKEREDLYQKWGIGLKTKHRSETIGVALMDKHKRYEPYKGKCSHCCQAGWF
ncbi:Kinesin-like protein [Quillaja saponaria]|uniref:Kinesin-like protein n=1 Tax=Quillaja saponaria TaxID=32244 RepID=A0AAD7LHA4_QUISA|nr:Kinesin-like protein [Quillaja saponaria]